MTLSIPLMLRSNDYPRVVSGPTSLVARARMTACRWSYSGRYIQVCDRDLRGSQLGESVPQSYSEFARWLHDLFDYKQVSGKNSLISTTARCDARTATWIISPQQHRCVPDGPCVRVGVREETTKDTYPLAIVQRIITECDEFRGWNYNIRH